MIEVQNLTFAYPTQPPLFDGLDWSVASGETWSVVGRSGCGNPTLLYLLTGLLQPAGGSIRIGGLPLARPRPRTGLILQDYGLLPWASVYDNAALGLRVRRFYGPDGRHSPEDVRLAPEEVAERVQFWLSRLDIAEQRDQFPAQLSGGQRQRVAIARTLAMRPDLLLMDEPFSSLDAMAREDLEELTLDLCAETGVTSAIVTHSIEEAVYLGRQILVLRRAPHAEALVVSNPGSGLAGYRGHAEFQARCNQVRASLEGAPHAQT